MNRMTTALICSLLAFSPLILSAAPLLQPELTDVRQDRKSQKKKEKEQKRAAVAEALSERTYVIEMQYATGQNGYAKSLSPGYRLEVNGDKAAANLPFYGRAYSIPYGSGGGISFEETGISNYEGKIKEDRQEISFEVQASGDTFKFFISVFPSGGTSVSVVSVNRASMNYRGEMIFE